ncbi:MAG: ABC transporter permease [Patescibacteria group bacterium]|nr:ABC transporter permease [Patescibacteria group bacterium]
MYFIQPIITIWQREIIRYWRDKTRIFSTLFQPLMFLVIFGAGLGSTLARGDFGVDFIQFMYPGIIAMSVMGVAFFSTISTVWDREFGFLKEILVAPVSRTAIAIGKTLGATTIAALQGLILLVIAPFIGLNLHLVMIPEIFSLMLLLSFAVAGMGLFIASLMKTTESFGLLMQVLVFPMFFLSGAFFPLTSVPSWMMALSRLNPLTYGVDAMRQIFLHNHISPEVSHRLILHPIYINVLFLVVFSAVLVSAAVIAFNKKN